LDGLLGWEFEYNEDTQAFSKEPVHNWASHPSDAFAYGCQVMQKDMPKPTEDETRWPAKALADGTIQLAPLEELWRDVPKRSGRI
jgi:phage terminase large subunit